MTPGRMLVLAIALVAGCGAPSHALPAVPSPPPRLAAVSQDGVRVLVPGDWPRNRLRCGTPVADTVVVDPGPIPACMVTNPPLVSYAWLRTSGDLRIDREATLATQPVTVSGHGARRGRDRLPDGRTRVVLVVVDRQVVVVAVSSRPDLALQIIDSASVV